MSSQTLLLNLQQVAAQATDKRRVFTNLAHLINMDLLRDSFHRLRKKAAPGIDGQTAADYAVELESNLGDLHERLRTLRYRATPARVAKIAKEDGSSRTIAIQVLEDKIVQRAVTTLFNAVYEQDFYEFSFGFREGTGAQKALHYLREKCMELKGVWLVDADIRGFFDHVDRAWLQRILKLRVNDGGIARLIGKWLHAGLQEKDQVYRPEAGVPQGGVISPILSNIYLHTVLDEWFAEVVQSRLRGRSFLVRFADDFVIGCELEDDVHRVLKVLPKRLGRFGLSLHPDKTRLVKFRKPLARLQRAKGDGTFDFLGFTHYWARSRRGYWVVKRRTSRHRLRRALRVMTQWCKRNRHMPLKEQHRRMCQKLLGHYGYYGISGNSFMMERFHHQVRIIWRKWLGRRSRDAAISWAKFRRMEKTYRLPRPRIVHGNV